GLADGVARPGRVVVSDSEGAGGAGRVRRQHQLAGVVDGVEVNRGGDANIGLIERAGYSLQRRLIVRIVPDVVVHGLRGACADGNVDSAGFDGAVLGTGQQAARVHLGRSQLADTDGVAGE